MPNLLQRGAAILGDRLQSAAGRSVTYTRRGQSLTATGWPAKQDYIIDNDAGIPQSVTFYDWTFATADLAFDDDPETFAARAGDQITETLNGQDLTYEVMPPGDRPVAEGLDTAGVLTLIHTKLINQCPTP
jgi:hypothetical protein